MNAIVRVDEPEGIPPPAVLRAGVRVCSPLRFQHRNHFCLLLALIVLKSKWHLMPVLLFL